MTLRPLSEVTSRRVSVVLDRTGQVRQGLPEADLLLGGVDGVAAQALEGVGELLRLGALVLELVGCDASLFGQLGLRVRGQLRLGVRLGQRVGVAGQQGAQLLGGRSLRLGFLGHPVERLRGHVRGSALDQALQGIVNGTDLLARLLQIVGVAAEVRDRVQRVADPIEGARVRKAGCGLAEAVQVLAERLRQLAGRFALLGEVQQAVRHLRDVRRSVVELADQLLDSPRHGGQACDDDTHAAEAHHDGPHPGGGDAQRSHGRAGGGDPGQKQQHGRGRQSGGAAEAGEQGDGALQARG